MLNNSVRTKHIDFIILDIISIIVSFVMSYLIRFNLEQGPDGVNKYRNMFIAILVFYFFVLLFRGIHSNILKRGVFSEFGHVIMVNAYIAFLVFGMLFVLKITGTFSRIAIVLFFIFDIFIMTFFRAFRKQQIRLGYRNGKNVSNSIIITYKSSFLEFYKTIDKNNTGFYKYVGVVFLDDAESDEVDWIIKDRELFVVPREDILDFVKENAVNIINKWLMISCKWELQYTLVLIWR